jgi:2,4'-dihydroxyacetophenone dioxygenase
MNDEQSQNLSEPGAYSGIAAVLGRALGEPAEGLARFAEVLVQTEDVEWEAKSLPGLWQKMLWRDDESGASIALIRFEQGAGVPSVHSHASNQFMFCLSGRYVYTKSGIVLGPGSFYWNPKGSEHGPTLAEEETIFIETYDGPHYPVQPSWYSDAEDAR